MAGLDHRMVCFIAMIVGIINGHDGIVGAAFIWVLIAIPMPEIAAYCFRHSHLWSLIY